MQDEKKSVAKVVISTVLGSFITLFVLSIIVVALMFFIFTRNLADFMYDIGANRIASTLY